jgi:hypothetical protein
MWSVIYMWCLLCFLKICSRSEMRNPTLRFVLVVLLVLHLVAAELLSVVVLVHLPVFSVLTALSFLRYSNFIRLHFLGCIHASE